jgi:hypothetical protein
MFDRVTEAAEKLATNVSRRAFLGGLGKGALTLAGAVGAFLAIPGLVQAGGGCTCSNGGGFLCKYSCNGGTTVYTTPGNGCSCAKTHKGCPLIDMGCFVE